MRQLEPQRTDLMEIYSTVLWHLHAEVQLSTLAQDLVSHDRNSAAAWCATGNLFSAQTEHETAIKFFQRAIQACAYPVYDAPGYDTNGAYVCSKVTYDFLIFLGGSQFPVRLYVTRTRIRLD